MAAESNEHGTAPPSSLCPKCGVRPRRAHGTYCRECTNASQLKRDRVRQEKSCRSRCEDCGGRLPHGGVCPAHRTRYHIERGRQKLNERWPGYGTLVADEVFLRRVGQNWPRVAHYPLPSRLFPNLDPKLDERLIREHRDKDVVLCHALATIPATDQRDFLELYLVDRVDAHRWAALSPWKRPIRKGDADDVLIWKFFTMQRLNMEQAASDAAPWAMASQGAQLKQLFGTLDRLSPIGVRRLCLVMATYGALLQDHRDVGDVVKKPWEHVS